MKKFIVLIAYFQISALTCCAQSLLRDSMFFQCLDIAVNDYYNAYYEYPNDVMKLVEFAEYRLDVYPDDGYSSCRERLLIEVLPYFKKNQERISIKNTKSGYAILMGSDTLLHGPTLFASFSPCEDSLFIGGNSREYYHFYDNFRMPRFFSLQNKTILYPDSVYRRFKNGVLDIQRKYLLPSSSSNPTKPYKYYIYEKDTVSVVSMLEYRYRDTIRYYCDGQLINLRIPFYQKLESFLESFCKAYKCQRILFMIPDYNISRNIKK